MDNDVIKMSAHYQFVTNFNAIYAKILSTSILVIKTQYDAGKQGIENKIPSVTGLLTTAALYTKATEVESKIPNITNLPRKAALNSKLEEIESKISDITNLANKVDLNTKVIEIENKILIHKFNFYC